MSRGLIGNGGRATEVEEEGVLPTTTAVFALTAWVVTLVLSGLVDFDLLVMRNTFGIGIY